MYPEVKIFEIHPFDERLSDPARARIRHSFSHYLILRTEVGSRTLAWHISPENARSDAALEDARAAMERRQPPSARKSAEVGYTEPDDPEAVMKKLALMVTNRGRLEYSILPDDLTDRTLAYLGFKQPPAKGEPTTKAPEFITFSAPIGARQPAKDPSISIVMLSDEIAVRIGRDTRYFSHDGLTYRGLESGRVSFPQIKPGRKATFSVPEGTSTVGNGVRLKASGDHLMVSTPQRDALFSREGLNFTGYQGDPEPQESETDIQTSEPEEYPTKPNGGPVVGGIFGLASSNDLRREMYGLNVVVSVSSPSESYDVPVSDEAAIELYERATADGHTVYGWPIHGGDYRITIDE